MMMIWKWITLECLMALILCILWYEYLRCPNVNVPELVKTTATEESSPQRYCILLTTWAGTHERRIHYEHILSQWGSKTIVPVYVVDSSGYTFPSISPSLQLLSFTQPEFVTRAKTKGPSWAERYAMLQAWNHWNDEWKKKGYTMIIKVTGKYFVPELLHIQIPRHVKLLVQHSTHTCCQNCEIVGIHRDLFLPLLNRVNKSAGTLERAVLRTSEDLVKLHNNNRSLVYRLPSFPQKESVRRSDGSTISVL